MSDSVASSLPAAQRWDVHRQPVPKEVNGFSVSFAHFKWPHDHGQVAASTWNNNLFLQVRWRMLWSAIQEHFGDSIAEISEELQRLFPESSRDVVPIAEKLCDNSRYHDIMNFVFFSKKASSGVLAEDLAVVLFLIMNDVQIRYEVSTSYVDTPKFFAKLKVKSPEWQELLDRANHLQKVSFWNVEERRAAMSRRCLDFQDVVFLINVIDSPWNAFMSVCYKHYTESKANSGPDDFLRVSMSRLSDSHSGWSIHDRVALFQSLQFTSTDASTFLDRDNTLYVAADAVKVELLSFWKCYGPDEGDIITHSDRLYVSMAVVYRLFQDTTHFRSNAMYLDHLYRLPLYSKVGDDNFINKGALADELSFRNKLTPLRSPDVAAADLLASLRGNSVVTEEMMKLARVFVNLIFGLKLKWDSSFHYWYVDLNAGEEWSREIRFHPYSSEQRYTNVDYWQQRTDRPWLVEIPSVRMMLTGRGSIKDNRAYYSKLQNSFYTAEVFARGMGPPVFSYFADHDMALWAVVRLLSDQATGADALAKVQRVVAVNYVKEIQIPVDGKEPEIWMDSEPECVLIGEADPDTDAENKMDLDPVPVTEEQPEAGEEPGAGEEPAAAEPEAEAGEEPEAVEEPEAEGVAEKPHNESDIKLLTESVRMLVTLIKNRESEISAERDRMDRTMNRFMDWVCDSRDAANRRPMLKKKVKRMATNAILHGGIRKPQT